MILQFKNTNNKIISEQQADGTYFKEYISKNTGLLKIKESKFNSVTERILYYKDIDETADGILYSYNNIESITVVKIRERVPYGNYTVEEEKIYWRNKTTRELELKPLIMKYLINSLGQNIAYELIDSSLSSTDENYRIVNKTYFIGLFTDYNKSDTALMSTKYNGYNQPFDFMVYDSGTGDDQDIDYLPLPQTIQVMTELGIPQNIQDWYLNDDFLPPLT